MRSGAAFFGAPNPPIMHSNVDPNLFFLDFERVSEVILAIIVLALLIERALAVIFENRLFIEKVAYDVQRAPRTASADGSAAPIVAVRSRNRGVKELIAIGVSFWVCWYWDFDALSILLPVSHSKMTLLGEFLTALIIAGGSKGAVKLFSDWMGIKSSAQKEIDAFKDRHKNSGANA